MSDPGHKQPSWARFMVPDEWRAFLVSVESELRRRKVSYRIRDGYVWAPWGGDVEEALSLLNLAQICHGAGRAAFERVISAHFDALVAGRADRVLADELVKDLARARPHLKVRLYPNESFHDQERDFVTREVSADLCAVLCFDLPSNVVTVNADALLSWGCTADDVWYQALANQKRTEHGTVEHVEVGGARLSALTGESFFVASNLLLLGDFLPDELPMGAIAAVPNRHTLVFHPITDSGSLRAIDAMVVMANNLFAKGPGAISANLFWWRDGALTTLPTRDTPQHFEFVPTKEFIDQVLDPLHSLEKLN
jgi:hypothetical protein